VKTFELLTSPEFSMFNLNKKQAINHLMATSYFNGYQLSLAGQVVKNGNVLESNILTKGYKSNFLMGREIL
jgi:hypothetical protein